MSVLHSPTVAAWQLGIRLRQRREQLGLTAAEVAKTVGCAQAYISGVEAGKVKLPEARLEQLVEAYELELDEAEKLEELRLRSHQPGWWHDYANILSDGFVRFLGFEAGAEQIRTYQSETIDGMLQTEEYARAVIKGGSPHVRLTEVDRRVAVRMARQARLDDGLPVRVTTVLAQGALMQRVGGGDVMRRQLEHMLTMMEEKPDLVDIRVMPFEAGAHPALGGPFYILSFGSSGLPDLVWQEILTSTDIIDHQARVTDYVITFAETLERALSPDESRDLIRAIAREMT